jgi:hypothetical protein
MNNMYIKKPVCVEARRIGNTESLEAMSKWCSGQVIDNKYINIPTLEGITRADYGDWIVKGVAGEFYPVKHDIFILTHEYI